MLNKEESNQFKNADNFNPTENPDVHYSLKGEQDMLNKIQRIREEGKKNGKTDAEIEDEIIEKVDAGYGQLLKLYGEIRRGERPTPEIKVPKHIKEKLHASQTIVDISSTISKPIQTVRKKNAISSKPIWKILSIVLIVCIIIASAVTAAIFIQKYNKVAEVPIKAATISSKTDSSTMQVLDEYAQTNSTSRASSFLQKKAEEQAARIEKEHGAGAYGSTTYLRDRDKKTNSTAPTAEEICNEYDFFHSHAVIVTAEAGKKYHRFGCRYISGRNLLIYNIENAKSKGYDSCSECFD